MRKVAARPTTLYNFVQRTDLTLSTSTADILTALLMYKERLRRKLQDKEFRDDLVDYTIIGVMTVAGGALFSLVITFVA
jgi:hypothetical protein